MRIQLDEEAFRAIELETRIDSMWERAIDRVDKMSESDDIVKQAFVNGFWYYAALISRENQLRKRNESK